MRIWADGHPRRRQTKKAEYQAIAGRRRLLYGQFRYLPSSTTEPVSQLNPARGLLRHPTISLTPTSYSAWSSSLLRQKPKRNREALVSRDQAAFFSLLTGRLSSRSSADSRNRNLWKSDSRSSQRKEPSDETRLGKAKQAKSSTFLS